MPAGSRHPTIRLRASQAAGAVADLNRYVTDLGKAVDIRESLELLGSATAVAEMFGLAEAADAHKPVLHIVYSWPPEQDVDSAEAFAYAERFRAFANLADSLFVDAVHGDSRCAHIHEIAINADPRTRQRLLTRPFGEIVRAFQKRERLASGQNLPPGARDAETWNGDASLVRFVRDEVARIAPTSAHQLDRELANCGILRVPRKGGWVFIDATAPRPIAIRSSTVALPTRLREQFKRIAPLQQLPGRRTRPSYWERVSAGELPAPDLSREQQAARAAWKTARANGETTMRFGAYLRRDSNAATTKDTEPHPSTKFRKMRQPLHDRSTPTTNDRRARHGTTMQQDIQTAERADAQSDQGLFQRAVSSLAKLGITAEEQFLNPQQLRAMIERHPTREFITLARDNERAYLYDIRQNAIMRLNAGGEFENLMELPEEQRIRIERSGDGLKSVIAERTQDEQIIRPSRSSPGAPNERAELEDEYLQILAPSAIPGILDQGDIQKWHDRFYPEYQNYVSGRIDSDRHLRGIIGSFNQHEQLVRESLQDALSDPKRKQTLDDLDVVSDHIVALRSIAIAQDRAAVELGLYEAQLRPLVPSYREYLQDFVKRGELDQTAMDALLDKGREADRTGAGKTQAFRYTDGYAPFANLIATRHGHDEARIDYSNYWASNLTPENLANGEPPKHTQLWFWEKDEVIHMAPRGLLWKQEHKEQALDAALILANERWGGVQLRGTQAYCERAIERCIALNIPVTDRTKAQEQYYERAKAAFAVDQQLTGRDGAIVLPKWAHDAARPLSKEQRAAITAEKTNENAKAKLTTIGDVRLAYALRALPNTVFAGGIKHVVDARDQAPSMKNGVFAGTLHADIGTIALIRGEHTLYAMTLSKAQVANKVFKAIDIGQAVQFSTGPNAKVGLLRDVEGNGSITIDDIQRTIGEKFVIEAEHQGGNDAADRDAEIEDPDRSDATEIDEQAIDIDPSLGELDVDEQELLEALSQRESGGRERA